MTFFSMSREGYVYYSSTLYLSIYQPTPAAVMISTFGTTMDDDPLFKAFDNPGIFRHIIQYLLVKKRYFVAVKNEFYRDQDVLHQGQLCRIEMKSRYRWIPNQGGVGIVDGEEDYMTENSSVHPVDVSNVDMVGELRLRYRQ